MSALIEAGLIIVATGYISARVQYLARERPDPYNPRHRRG